MFGLPSFAVNIIGGFLLAALVAGGGALVARHWYAPQIAGYRAQIAAANTEAKAIKTAQTSLTRTNGMAEDQAQTTIVRQTHTIIEKVPIYVPTTPTSAVGCVTNGMLRLHDAAVLGIDPADLPPPAAQSDAACSAVAPSDFMAAIVGNYAVARQNAEQLNSLEADIAARIEVTK